MRLHCTPPRALSEPFYDGFGSRTIALHVTGPCQGKTTAPPGPLHSAEAHENRDHPATIVPLGQREMKPLV